MKITFDTSDGKIEVDGDKQLVYFPGQDIEVTLAADGTFQDLNGREYRVLWPILKSQKIATLQVKEWRYLDARES